ncbi:MAG: O-antigen ligase family protein [Clostridia bacterium]|nr:O-antigen ligase family protein [Clostridia bacterium]
MKKNIGLAADAARSALLWAASNVSLYVFMAFFYTGVLTMGILFYHHLEPVEMVGRYVLIPWGMALCLLRLYKGAQSERKPSAELIPLGLLVFWLAVPYVMRFGLTVNNMDCWSWYASVYFGVYALASEESAARRESLMDTICAVFLVFSLVYAGLALYTAYTVQALWEIPGSIYGFGICDGMYLRGGVHYNITGMIAVCSAMICLCGAARWRFAPLRALSLTASVMMMVVVVLTQSRTARYALIGALAAGAYALVAGTGKRTPLRRAMGAAVGGVVLVGAYLGMGAVSDAALAHYDHVRAARAYAAAQALATPEPAEAAEPARSFEPEEALEPAESIDPEMNPESVQTPEMAPDAAANPDAGEGVEEPEAVASAPLAQEATPVPVATPEPLVPREAVDASFSGRTELWRNLLALWRDDPWHLLIGNGAGRSGGMVVEGTMHESLTEISLHNAYLQFVADFGLIGFVLKALFFAFILRPVLRVFSAPRRELRGELALCMLVVACLLTGLMESAPLSWRTPMNVTLYFALGVLVSKGRELAQRA